MITNKERVLGSLITITTYAEATQHILEWACQGSSHYVIAANVHVVMTGVWDPSFRAVLAQADLVTPDGMPLVWALRSLGFKKATRVYGPDLMLEICQQAAIQGIPIFLYGSTPQTLEQLKARLIQRFPDLLIAGSLAPPFGSVTSLELADHAQAISDTGAKLVFVGLGCPKQEFWMAQQRHRLPLVMIGVGAAFDFHSGQISQAPRWMMRSGLEWLYRFGQEPRRLWKRYLINNPTFVILFTAQWIRHRFFQRQP